MHKYGAYYTFSSVLFLGLSGESDSFEVFQQVPVLGEGLNGEHI